MLHENHYGFSAILKSYDQITNKFNYEVFNLWDIQTKNLTKSLKPKDEVIILSWDDVNFFNDFKFLNNNCRANKDLKDIINSRKNPFYNFFNTNQLEKGSTIYKNNLVENICPDIYLNEPGLLSFVFDNLIYLDGDSFNKSGFYFVNEDFKVGSLFNFIGNNRKNYTRLSNKIITLASNKINLKVHLNSKHL